MLLRRDPGCIATAACDETRDGGLDVEEPQSETDPVAWLLTCKRLQRRRHQMDKDADLAVDLHTSCARVL